MDETSRAEVPEADSTNDMSDALSVTQDEANTARKRRRTSQTESLDVLPTPKKNRKKRETKTEPPPVELSAQTMATMQEDEPSAAVALAVASTRTRAHETERASSPSPPPQYAHDGVPDAERGPDAEHGHEATSKMLLLLSSPPPASDILDKRAVAEPGSSSRESPRSGDCMQAPGLEQKMYTAAAHQNSYADEAAGKPGQPADGESTRRARELIRLDSSIPHSLIRDFANPKADSVYSAVREAVRRGELADLTHLLFDQKCRQTAVGEYDFFSRCQFHITPADRPEWDAAARNAEKRARKKAEAVAGG